MEKYSKILIYIFLVCIINLIVSTYIIFRINNLPNNTTTQQTPIKQVPSPIPTGTLKGSIPDDIKTDLTQIKAEIRSLREILGISGSFEELSNLIKNLNQTDKPE